MKKLVFFFTCIVVFSAVNAQSGITENTWRISFEPQYLVINGMKLNVEKRLRKTTDWLIISPALYYKEYETVDVSQYDYSYENGFTTTKNIKEVKGAGLTIENRILLSSPTYSKSIGFSIAPYFSYGAMYNLFEITREDDGFIEVNQDGVPYLIPGIVQTKKDIHKTGLNFTLGLQTEVLQNIITEFYLGFGIRYSFYDGEYKYNKSALDYGYKGVILLGGFKLGVGF